VPNQSVLVAGVADSPGWLRAVPTVLLEAGDAGLLGCNMPAVGRIGLVAPLCAHDRSAGRLAIPSRLPLAAALNLWSSIVMTSSMKLKRSLHIYLHDHTMAVSVVYGKHGHAPKVAVNIRSALGCDCNSLQVFAARHSPERRAKLVAPLELLLTH